MNTYRVNTPGPSFTVHAETLDRATLVAVSKGFPVPTVNNGWYCTQRDTMDPEGRVVRRVARWTKTGDQPVTGFAIYLEVLRDRGF
jgi:hypothetical protein